MGLPCAPNLDAGELRSLYLVLVDQPTSPAVHKDPSLTTAFNDVTLDMWSRTCVDLDG